MASPQKPTSPPPIVFTTRVVKPDVLLEVLGQDFHVMSPALKMHSAFFAAFLDSSNKASATPANPKFNYHWGTTIDKDGSWGLVSIGCLEESNEKHKLKGDAQLQIESFRILMCAIHSTPFTIAIDGIEVLETTTTLADYYRALPILSIAVSAVLFSRPDFLFEIPKHCVRLLSISAQLRNAVLFHECLLHACGPWTEPRYLTLPEGKIRAACETAYGKMCIKTYKAQNQLLESIPNHDEVGRTMVALVSKCMDGPRIVIPYYYRTLIVELGYIPKVTLAIVPLMRNALVLEWFPSHPGVGGREGLEYKDFFFCLERDDVELPWDVTQVDW